MFRYVKILSIMTLLTSCATTGLSRRTVIDGERNSTPTSLEKLDQCLVEESRKSFHQLPKAVSDERSLEAGLWKDITVKSEVLGLSLQDALISLGQELGIKISAASDIEGIVTTAVKGMNLTKALNAILRVNGADWVYDPAQDVIYAASTLQGALGRHQILSTYVTKAKFISSATIVKMISGPYREYISTDLSEDRAGLIKVVAPTGIMLQIYKEINELDRQPPQVLLDLSIYEIDQSELLDIGRIGGDGSAYSGITSPLTELSRASGEMVLGSAATNIFLNHLQVLAQSGKAEIVSSPKAIVVDGKFAEFMTTETLIDALQTVTAGNIGASSKLSSLKEISLRTGMRIRPVVLPDNDIMLYIDNAESGSLSDETRLRIKRHKLQTDVMIQSGQTLLLGGAIYEKESEEVIGVPMLKDVWVLDSLFSRKVKQKKRVQVLFSIRPKILCGRGAAASALLE